MKIRNGFVSNSSSSSFVLIGAYTNDVTETVLKNALNDLTIVDENENEKIGEIIASTTDEVMDENEFSFSKLQEIRNQLAKKLNLPEDKIKIFTGTTQC